MTGAEYRKPGRTTRSTLTLCGALLDQPLAVPPLCQAQKQDDPGAIAPAD
jgi:hypothetical protein